METCPKCSTGTLQMSFEANGEVLNRCSKCNYSEEA